MVILKSVDYEKLKRWMFFIEVLKLTWSFLVKNIISKLSNFGLLVNICTVRLLLLPQSIIKGNQIRIFSLKIGLSSSKKKMFYLHQWKPVKNDEKWFLFNVDLNRGYLVYRFSLRFLGSKLSINLRRQFRVRKIFSST